MLRKLQRKTLIPAQIAGYALTLLVGVAIVLLSLQVYCDIKPLLTHQTDVFKAHTVTVSKNVTVFKTANKEGLYFSEKELDKLKSQEFVKNVAQFRSASFATKAAISFEGQRMSTDLFFESVPDGYLDVESDDWKWDSTADFLPIVIPEDYLNLYNFGFAESQSLPVVSAPVLSQITFSIFVEGNGKSKVFKSRIVGLSGKINSILVPDDFLQWANSEFGTSEEHSSSRLLVEFTDASDERIPQYFEANGLNINKTELETSKMAFFFKLAMLFVTIIAAIIIVLSVAFIIMSMNLIVQRNREMFVNLYNIGYSHKVISRFYKVIVSIITAVDILLASALVLLVRGWYMGRLSVLFDTGGGIIPTLAGAAILLALLLIICNIFTDRVIRNIIK